MSNKEQLSLQISEDKQIVSARVNSQVVEVYKDSGIPLSLVIENSLISFLRLSEKEKIKFLSQNMVDDVKKDELKPLSKNWKDLLKEYLVKFNVPSSVAPKLLSGLCVGAIGLIGGVLIAIIGNRHTEEET